MTYEELLKLQEAIKFCDEARHILQESKVEKEEKEKVRYRLVQVINRIEAVIEADSAR